jgi:hypothetical protein
MVDEKSLRQESSVIMAVNFCKRGLRESNLGTDPDGYIYFQFQNKYNPDSTA